MSTQLLRDVPAEIPRPDYAQPGANGVPKSVQRDAFGRRKVMRNFMKGEDLERMRKACRAAREVLDEVLAADQHFPRGVHR